MTRQHIPRRILPAIVIAEFLATSLWFATNAVVPDLQQEWNAGPEVVGLVTSSVQIGFILGTLCFAFFTIADRYSPRVLFCCCALAGAGFNAMIYLVSANLPLVLLLRVATGVCLAGIYPIGMKIASGWYKEGLGNALGFLVGALVVGTAFPHLVRSLVHELHWESVLYIVSLIAVAGGILMAVFVPDGPYLVKGTPFNSKAFSIIFKSKELRAAAFGYFGHMWELYTFYAFVPTVIAGYVAVHLADPVDVSLWSFLIIAAGGIGCAVGGLFSLRFGSARIARFYLFCSGVLCLFAPLLFNTPLPVFLGVLVVWGIVVVGDSPQFSTLIASYAPKELVGSALTIGNSIGFAITIVSIQFVSMMLPVVGTNHIFLLLTIGPVLGLAASRKLL